MGRGWLALVLLMGCYRSHELGDRPRVDAGASDLGPMVGRDFGPRPVDLGPDLPPPRDGVYWTLSEREVQLSIPHELGCLVHEGGRITVRADFAVDSECEHAGPVVVDRAGGGTFLVRGYVWERHDPDPEACLGITWLESRHLHVEAPDEGSFTFEDALGGSVVTAEVVREASPACADGPEGAPCTVDCQCAGELVCVPQLGDFVECHGGRCQRPCDLPNAPEGPVYGRHLDCPIHQQCADRGALAAPTCGATAGDGCAAAPGLCGPGTFCPLAGMVTECLWNTELNGMVRHPCDSDADCSEGLHCVEHETGERICEVPCFTHRMACPPMHACSPTRWVCEWLGE